MHIKDCLVTRHHIAITIHMRRNEIAQVSSLSVVLLLLDQGLNDSLPPVRKELQCSTLRRMETPLQSKTKPGSSGAEPISALTSANKAS